MVNETQWKRMLFRGCKVYAQVSQDGTLLAKDGVVKIKYQLQQENEYVARASAIQEITESELKKSKNQREKKEKPPRIQKSPLLSEEDFDNNTIFVFTDGACTGNPGPAGIGVFLQYRDHRKEISRFIGSGTNNTAELIAIKVALQEIKDPTLPVALFTDSSYCYGVLTGSFKAKKNRDLVEQIKKEMRRFPLLKFIKVEGHKGIEGNEKANLLAQQAIAQLKGTNA
ncbi:MAG TPA: ribonuclease H [Thermodesulfobacteriota bacterium]|nr:ribonuclease H [Thermodesulfobacteriota bacterium]